MNPAPFSESNGVLNGPADMPDCHPLEILRTVTDDGQPVILSAWEPTEAERRAIAGGEKIWLCICGRTMPPVSLGAGRRNPFVV